MALKMIVTDAGIEALINAEQTGTAPVVLAAVGLGTGKYTATASQTAMRAQFKTLATVSGGVVGDNVIHLEATDSSSDQYECFEVGVYTDGGILFGIVSSTTAIIEKAAGAQSMLAIDFVVSGATPETITVGDITINVPPATTEVQGIVELATDAETQAGTDTTRAVTPKSLASLAASAVRRGLVELATSAETQAGTDADRAVTPQSLASLVATEILRGLVELATTAEATAGTDTSRAVTPAGLAAAILAKVPKSIGSGTKPVYTNANGKVTASGSSVGSATNPIYMSGGTITQCSYTLEKSVPANAVFTDTNKVTRVGTRSGTNGNWSITGLTVGEPLILVHSAKNASTSSNCKVRISSGAAGGVNSSAHYDIGLNRAECFIAIPTATTVVVNITDAADDGDIIYAYQ